MCNIMYYYVEKENHEWQKNTGAFLRHHAGVHFFHPTSARLDADAAERFCLRQKGYT